MTIKKKLAVIGFLICLILSGCTEAKTPRNLIRKPEVNLEQKEFSDIIFQFLSDEEVLTLITGEKDQEPIRRIDMDGDGSYEMILPFKSNKDMNTFGIKILKKKKDKWHEINKITGLSDGFHFIKNIDITNDKKPEIIIGTVGKNKIDNNLKVYSYHDGYFRNIHSGNYTHLSIEDLNADGQKELIILDSQLDQDSFIIEVLGFSNNEIKPIDQYTIKSNKYLNNMRAGNGTAEEKGIFLDFNIGEYSGSTTILVMRNNKLIKAFDEKDYGHRILEIENTAGSEDINKDGIVEIGFLKKITHISNMSIKDIPVVKYWYQWDGKDDLILTYKEYYSYDAGYKIQIPKEWGEDYKIQESQEGIKTAKFYSLRDSKRINELIFEIQYFSNKEWEKEKSRIEDKGYIVLDHDFKGITIGILSDIHKKSKFYLDEEGLKNLFSNL